VFQKEPCNGIPNVTETFTLSFKVLDDGQQHLEYHCKALFETPTERPQLVGEVGANFCGQRVSRGQHDWSPLPYSRFSRPANA
jgi:hypothetical protein